MGGREGSVGGIPIVEVGGNRFVHVPSEKLMKGVYADLHGTKPCVGEYGLTHEKVENAQFYGFKVAMDIECASSLVPGEYIRLRAAGAVRYGNVGAERACMMKMLDIIRNECKLFPADFSLVEIQANRSLYAAMNNALEPARINFRKLMTLFSDSHEELSRLCAECSVWVGTNITEADEVDRDAVISFYGKMSYQLRLLEEELGHARRTCDVLELRKRIPEDLRRFEGSVPVDLVINWEQSENTLAAVFSEAVTKFRGGVSKVEVFNLGVGEVRAVLAVVGPPHRFTGDIGASKKEALAKLYYKVIKYLQDTDGFRILDFHYEVLEYQLAYIDRFDQMMGAMVSFAERLKLLFDDTSRAFDECVADLLGKMAISDVTGPVLEGVHGAGVMLRANKIHAESGWETLHGSKVDRATLEWKVKHGR